MKRRRGELSLFEILRDPEDKSKAGASAVPSAGGRSVRAVGGDAKSSSAGLLPSDGPPTDGAPTGGAGETDEAAAVGGSSTPAPPESRPRLDVTPSSRSSRNRLAAELANDSGSSDEGAADGEAAEEAPSKGGGRLRLPELAPELTSPDPSTI